MKKQIVFGLFLIAGLAAVFAFKHESSRPKYLTMTFVPGAFISIVDEKGTSEKIELKSALTIMANSEKWVEFAQTRLTSEFNRLSEQGYTLVSSSSAGNAIYIFEKK